MFLVTKSELEDSLSYVNQNIGYLEKVAQRNADNHVESANKIRSLTMRLDEAEKQIENLKRLLNYKTDMQYGTPFWNTKETHSIELGGHKRTQNVTPTETRDYNTRDEVVKPDQKKRKGKR